ncbi:MAG: c-type cytochrome [Acidobacteria bacterium]|nr:c-type cytochrome [Acidobacteriota bacterium]
MATKIRLDDETAAVLARFNEGLERTKEQDRRVKTVAKAERFKDEAAKKVKSLESGDGSGENRSEAQEQYRIAAEQWQTMKTRLDAGVHRIAVAVNASGKPAQFHLRLRERSSSAERERLIGLALAGRGNVRRGREVFQNVEKSLCLKCHRIGEKGERIGPDLTGVGSRFSKIHLIESILEPSRTIAPSYETRVIVLKSGRVLTGVKAAETALTLTLADSEGKKRVVQKSEIEETRNQSKSTMPDGVEKRLTAREFVDLIGFLLSEKKN